MAVLTPGECPSPWPVLGRARLKQVAEDFVVEELLGFMPDSGSVPDASSGPGEHLWLWVEKRHLNTDQVALELSRVLGVARDAVSFSGLKDRHALTRQWFSVHWHGEGAWSLGEGWQRVGESAQDATPESATVTDVVSDIGTYRVLAQQRAQRKLRRGVHAGNRFVITLRQVTADRDVVDARLAELAISGVPNYVGPQRFGHDGRNIARGLALLADRRGGRRRRRDTRDSLWLSAVRSALFNQVLAARVQDGSWQRLLPGDVLQLDGRSAVFLADVNDPALPERLGGGELHVTGPLPGDGDALVRDAAAAFEAQVLAPWADTCADLAAARLPSLRRALRLRVQDLIWQWPDDDTLSLSFTLTAGAFATSVLATLFELENAHEPELAALSAEQ